MPARESRRTAPRLRAQAVLEVGWKLAYWPSVSVIHSHKRTFRYEYSRNFLCHKKLNEQFGIHTVPAWKNVISSTLSSIKIDADFIIKHERNFFASLLMIFNVPFLSFASVYGQYKGARASKKFTSLKR